MKNINKFVFGVFALSALILSSCGSGGSPSSSSPSSAPSKTEPPMSTSQKTEPPMSTSQKTEPSSSSSPLSSSSTTPASSSSAAPTPTFDHEALKRCFNNLTKYEAQFDFKLSGTSVHEGLQSVNAAKISTIYRMDGSEFTTDYLSEETMSYKLSEAAEAMHLTIEQAVEYFEDEHMIADVEKDIVYGLQSEEEHYFYHYDTTRSNLSLSQYVRYTYDDDQNNIVDGTYVDSSESRGIRAFMNVVIIIVNNGKPDYVNKTVNYTLLDETRANEELFTLTNGISSMFKSAKVSVSDDNLPTKIDFELDENMFKGMFPGGFDEAEASLKLSDFGNVTLTPPEGDVLCPSSHGCHVENYGHNSQYHWLYCSECGAFSTPEVEHTFDATHQVCTTCGYVKGVSPLMNDYKYANEIGDFYHAFKYKESAKGEAYDVDLFYSQTQPGDGDEFKIGNVNYVTRPALQALIAYADYEGDYLASHKCAKLLSTTYKLYLNIDAGYNGVEYVVDGVPLPDYLASVTPDATLVGYRAELAHNINGGHNESDSDCFRCSYDLCGRDSRLQYTQCEHHHDNIVDLEKVSYPFGLFGQRVNNMNMMNDNLICLKGKCADCEKEVYVVTEKYAAAYHNISTGGGNLTPVPCYVLFKEGVRTVIYSTSDLEIGHIYDNHTCVLCDDGAREIIDTDVVFSYKLNEEGDAIISYDFLVTSMGEHVNIMNGVGGYEMAGGDSPLGAGLVRETGYYTPEGEARKVIFYCDHTNSSEITYMKISCGSNTVFTFGSLE